MYSMQVGKGLLLVALAVEHLSENQTSQFVLPQGLDQRNPEPVASMAVQTP